MDLPINKIHILKSDLDQDDKISSALFSILSGDEKIKAEKFRTNHLKNRWIVSRGVLRLLLSRYCSCPPDEIKFNFNEYGKPLMSENSDITFNLSHSGNLALYIFARNRKVGIDLEKKDELPDVDGLSAICFSDHEKKWFNTYTSAEKKELFYKLWTCKEAYIKAIGKGFSFPPGKISLDLNSAQDLYFKEIIGDNEFNTWSIIKIITHEDFAASAVIEGNDFIIEQFQIKLFIDDTQSLSSDSSINYSIEKL